MQAFQPRPIQLPGSHNSGSPFDSGGGIDFSKIMRVGLIIGLVIFAIFIISVGRSYTVRQHNVAQNQDIRPLGQVHTETVQVSMPTASELVQLPIFVQGTAQLDWFADGVFPVEIRDGKNIVLASTYAIADVVDPNTKTANFRAVIEGFDVRPETRIGRVVLYRQEVRENPGMDDIASIGIDFTRIGDKWQKPDTSSSTTTTSTSSTTKESVWSDLYINKDKDGKTTTNSQATTQKTSTSTKYQKVVGGPFTCANGIDDDGDKQIDSDDPSCHSDGYPSNARTYDGDLDEAKRAVTERDENGNLPGATDTTNGGSANTTKPADYNQTGTIWRGNTKIHVEENP